MGKRNANVRSTLGSNMINDLLRFIRYNTQSSREEATNDSCVLTCLHVVMLMPSRVASLWFRTNSHYAFEIPVQNLIAATEGCSLTYSALVTQLFINRFQEEYEPRISHQQSNWISSLRSLFLKSPWRRATSPQDITLIAVPTSWTDRNGFQVRRMFGRCPRSLRGRRTCTPAQPTRFSRSKCDSPA